MFIRCLLLIPCLSQSARPSASIYHLGTEDPCEQFGAEKLEQLAKGLASRVRSFVGRKRHWCRCKPGAKAGHSCGFSPPRAVFHADEAHEGCKCHKDVCFNLGAKHNSSSCSCRRGQMPNNDCGRSERRGMMWVSRQPGGPGLKAQVSREEEPEFHFFPGEAGFNEAKCQCIDHPCTKFLGFPMLKFAEVCHCDLSVANHKCSAPGARYLELTEKPGCWCQDKAYFARAEKIPVKVAALQFCQHAAEAAEKFWSKPRAFNGFGMGRMGLPQWAKDNGPGTADLCQHVLTNSLSATEATKAPWAAKAAKESQGKGWGSFFGALLSGQSTKRFGRMGPLVQDASPEEQELWSHSLGRVCHDECLELVSQTIKNLHDLALRDKGSGISTTRSCAERVVRKVEAEIMGCCGRTCGWNNKTCMSWPFLSKPDRVTWVVLTNSQCLKHVESIIHASTHFSETSAV